MKNILLFDADDTLFNFQKCENVALENLFNQYKIDYSKENINLYHKANSALWKKFELGQVNIDELKVQRFIDFIELSHLDYDPIKMAYDFINELKQGYYLMDNAEKIIQELYPDNDLYIVTNGISAVQRNRLKISTIDKYITDIFISEEIGFSKPNIKYFEHVFNALSLTNKENVYIIGDSLNSDIQGGINANIKTIWFNPGHKINTNDINPTHEIDNLNDIITIMKKDTVK